MSILRIVVGCGLMMWTVPMMAQQTLPLDYIESTSPIPGVGVVSSVYVPGRDKPSYRGGPGIPTGTQYAQPGNTQLDLRFAQNTMPAAAPQVAPPAWQTPYHTVSPTALTMNHPMLTASRIPALGIPVGWDRSMTTAGCSSCGVLPGQTAVPQTVNPTYAYYAGSLNAGSASRQAVPFGSPVAGPVVVQNLPPNTSDGRSMYGSARQYMDGQPVRNLFRFIFP